MGNRLRVVVPCQMDWVQEVIPICKILGELGAGGTGMD